MICRRLPFRSRHPHKRTGPLHGTTMVLTVGCLLTLGCGGRNLPYSIAIGNPDPNTTPPGKEQCVLRLDDIVKDISKQYQLSGWTLRELQAEFEQALHNGTRGSSGVSNCKDSHGQLVAKEDYPPLEEVSKKWLRTYALDATDPDQSLDRLREYLLSARLVRDLAKQQLFPDEHEDDTSSLVEKTTMQQSQWCGALTTESSTSLFPFIAQTAQSEPLQTQAENEEHALSGSPESSCLKARSLYRVETSLAFDGQGQRDVYETLLHDMVQVEQAATERAHRYHLLSYEIPWDKEHTLVRYGVTFYFKEDGQGHKASVSTSTLPVHLVGYDLTYANEASPKPETQTNTDNTPETPWSAEELWHYTGRPFSLVIGIKNAAFEVIKLPFSTVAGLFFGRDPLNYPVENFLAAYNTLFVEATTQTHRGAEWGLYRLLLEVPLVGQLFQYNNGVDYSNPDEISAASHKIFLSRGIYGGNKWGQDTGLWALFAKQHYPGYGIYSPPYRHGTVIDVAWSMFNLSHGPAYSEARYIMDHASTEDRLYLAGHSGGVQRSAAASRILSLHGYRVVKVFGIAGPSIGQAIVDARYPDAFKIYLNTKSGANQDVVSKVGVVAGAFSTVLDYAVISPLKYVTGGLVSWNPDYRDQVYHHADRFGFSNAMIVEVERKPSSRHQTPLRLSFTDRVIFDAYVRNEFSTAFREDLERPGDTHETDRPNAFEWHR